MNDRISTKISVAKSRITDAERTLEAAIASSEGGSRAHKVTVNTALGEALRQLKEAIAILEALEINETVDPPR